jgi:hypothetical protein
MRAFPSHCSLLLRKDVVDQLSGYNPRFISSEDYDLYLRMLEAGKLASVDKPLVKIRKHERSVSNLEGGKLQIRMGIVAAVCHFLRTHHHPDPSSGTSESSWQALVSWVDKRISEERIFERRRAWSDARAAFFAAENRLVGAFLFGTRLVRSGHAAVSLWEKLVGFSLPERLATEWTRQPAARRTAT